MKSISFCISALTFLSVVVAMADAQLWWERGADKWYYKDDWKGLALSGGKVYKKAIQVHDAAVSGWILVWGKSGYRLKVNEQLIGSSVDGSLIDDYDISQFLGAGAMEVTIIIEGGEVCAEGEIVGSDGKRYPFATGDDWLKDDGGKPGTKEMVVGPSTGAYHRAHNGRLVTYNDEETGKTAIAKCLARVQKLNDQGIFLMRRFRLAEEIVSFDPDLPWRVSERLATPLIDEALSIITEKAIPAQKSGNFAGAITAAGEAAILISAAESPVTTATGIYQAEREILHLENWAALVEHTEMTEELGELKRLSTSARDAFALEDWASAQKSVNRIADTSRDMRFRLEKLAVEAFGQIVDGMGSLDEFPEDQFGWLNARALMGNDPANWQFSVSPSSCAYMDLSGKWSFRTDPDNVGESDDGWREMLVPMPWERQGVTEDNLSSPEDAPYKLSDARCGDKPYNGFAWYRKGVLIPSSWQGKRVTLATGNVYNWARIFINGKPVGEGERNPPVKHEIPPELISFGAENVIAIQVYNHNNFGGIESGQIALYADDSEPELRETPGPLSYTREYDYPTPEGNVRYTFLASAMSPAVTVATDGSTLELWGWEAKGYSPPSIARFMRDQTFQSSELDGQTELDGPSLSENWILLQSDDAHVLVTLERRPQSIEWAENEIGAGCLRISYESNPVRAAVLAVAAKRMQNENVCRFWARAMRRIPVAASECVSIENLRRIRYNYLDLDSFDNAEPLTIAPVPMLASYGLKYKHPGISLSDAARETVYESEYAPYLVLEDTDTVEYCAHAVNRSRVMKGVGELFGKHTAEQNMRGGVSEDEMFRRMAEWGFDHCRYAWAFHANWDLPLVEYMGGPIIEDNEAMWERLDEFVDKCNAVGMQMMLCWFFNEDSPQRDTGGAVRNSTRYWKARPETPKNAFELWRRIAERYADRPDWAISYDFFNEPAYMNTDHWKEVMKELTAIIRSVDKKHTIVWESADGWAQPQWCLWMKPVDDANVVYSFHHYGKHWGYAFDEYYPSYQNTTERTHIDHWLEAILFSIRYNVPIHCGEFGISMIQPDADGEAWLNDYLALFERFGIGWNWWNYSGHDIYRTGLAAGDRISPYVPILSKWMARSGWGASRRVSGKDRND